MKQEEDVFGKAIWDFYNDQHTEDIIVQAPDFDDDIIPVPYLFRTYSEMPRIEQKALNLSFGKVLDIGCGAGSHSLYLQNEKKLEVTSIDISPGSIKTCKNRGLKNTKTQNFFDIKGEKFDTLLFLMNGSGIIGRLKDIDHFLSHIKTLLNTNGQVLIDSSDISYLFMDDDGGFWVDTSAAYYGEMQYRMQYQNLATEWFDWLYIDYNTLQTAAIYNGFVCELITEGENQSYLARLTMDDDTL